MHSAIKCDIAINLWDIFVVKFHVFRRSIFSKIYVAEKKNVSFVKKS